MTRTQFSSPICCRISSARVWACRISVANCAGPRMFHSDGDGGEGSGGVSGLRRPRPEARTGGAGDLLLPQGVLVRPRFRVATSISMPRPASTSRLAQSHQRDSLSPDPSHHHHWEEREAGSGVALAPAQPPLASQDQSYSSLGVLTLAHASLYTTFFFSASSTNRSKTL